jgi:hypothetical protein
MVSSLFQTFTAPSCPYEITGIQSEKDVSTTVTTVSAVWLFAPSEAVTVLNTSPPTPKPLSSLSSPSSYPPPDRPQKSTVALELFHFTIRYSFPLFIILSATSLIDSRLSRASPCSHI